MRTPECVIRAFRTELVPDFNRIRHRSGDLLVAVMVTLPQSVRGANPLVLVHLQLDLLPARHFELEFGYSFGF